nr:MAG TPA: hypothetical protein [Caudoviricetes sp.]
MCQVWFLPDRMPPRLFDFYTVDSYIRKLSTDHCHCAYI